jgi:hypothetical protein
VPLLFAPKCSEKNSRNKKRGKHCRRKKRKKSYKIGKKTKGKNS